VTPAALTITATPQTKVYGSTLVFGTGSTNFLSVGLQNGESLGSVTVSGLGGAAVSSIGTYIITPSAVTGGTANLSNYAVNYAEGHLTVTNAPLIVRALRQIRAYGTPIGFGPGWTNKFNADGLQNGDSVISVTLTNALESGTLAVGTYTNSIVANSAVGSNLTNYTITYVPNSLSVTQAPLTVTASAQSKTYGDKLVFSTGTNQFTAKGLQNGEFVGSVTLACSGGGTNVGVGQYPITVTNAVGGTFNITNYQVEYLDGLLTVTPAELGIVSDSKSQVYGDASPDFTGSVYGSKNGEEFILTHAPTATNNSPVGPYNIIPNVTGATVANYTIYKTNGVLTVTRAALTITADSKIRKYGADNSSFTGSQSGNKNGEVFTLSYTTRATAASPVGTYDIVPSAAGTTVDNYTVTPVSGALTITPADLLIAADNQTKFYGQTNVFGVGMTNKFTPTGLKNGEWIGSVTLTCTGGAPTNTVGTYPIEISGATGGTADLTNNYAVSYTNGVLTVKPALLTIKADNQSKEYGQVMTFMQSVTNNWTATGLVNGETIGAVTLTCYGGPATSGARDWAITPSGATNGTASLTNYAVAYAVGQLTVRPAPITISADSKGRIYGDSNPTFTGSVSATKNGDVLAVSCNNIATTSSPVGSYDIVPSLMGTYATNYTATAVKGTLTVSPAPLTITADNQSKPYGQTLLFGPGSTAFRTDGIKNGEIIGSVTLACAGGVATNSPGTYTISISNAIGGTANLANYTPTYLPGALTVELSRLQLSIRAAGTNLIVSGVGAAGLPYRVDISSDLAAWVPWSTNSTGPNGTFELIDPAAAKRFYRAIQVNP
jgi:hypothetical protein